MASREGRLSANENPIFYLSDFHLSSLSEKNVQKKEEKRNEKLSHSKRMFARKIVPSREAPFNKLTNR